MRIKLGWIKLLKQLLYKKDSLIGNLVINL